MTDLVETTINSLIEQQVFKDKLKVHLDNIMKDKKITQSDLPDLVLFLVECYNGISNLELSYNEIPVFLRRLIKKIIRINKIIPEDQEDHFLNLADTAIKLVMIQPKIKKFCLEKFLCCK